MASNIRRSITERILSALNSAFPSFPCKEQAILSHIRINKRPSNHPQLLFSLTSMLEKNNIPEKSLDSSELFSKLRNKPTISSDGILDINFSEDKYQNIIFTIHKQKFVQDILQDIYSDLEAPSSNNCILQSIPFQRIVIDYSSPNIAKAFHAGHLRSTIIGNFIANLHEFLGHKVTRINYLGDWGTQYGLVSAGFEEFGSEEELQNDPIKHLLQVYIAANRKANEDILFQDKARKYFSLMENGNEGLLNQWKLFKELSIREYKTIYERLGIEFDEYHSESMYSTRAKKIVKELKNKFKLEESSDGLVKLNIPVDSNQEMKITLEKSDGSTLYLSRDIAAVLDRKEKYQFDKAYYVVDNSQSDHFLSLIAIIKMMGYDWFSSIHHVKFGQIEGLSTRRGNLIYLKDLIEEATKKALTSMLNSQTTKVIDNMKEIADVIGISALIINDLKNKRQNNYKFNWEKALDMKGSSAMALQYNHARLFSIERNCGIHLNPNCETKYLMEQEAINLVQHIARFDEIIMEAYNKLEPCIIVQYLFILCNLLGKAYRALPVKGQDKVIAMSRLFLFHTSRNVLQTGMKILGLQPLDMM